MMEEEYDLRTDKTALNPQSLFDSFCQREDKVSSDHTVGTYFDYEKNQCYTGNSSSTDSEVSEFYNINDLRRSSLSRTTREKIMEIDSIV